MPRDPVDREKMSETDLVTLIGNEGAGRDASGAGAELRRRNIVASRELNASIKQFERTSRRLTKWLIVLTAVLVVLTIRLAIR